MFAAFIAILTLGLNLAHCFKAIGAINTRYDERK